MQAVMRRGTFGAAIVLVGLFAFAGSAEAVMFNNVAAWWNNLNCDRMNAVINSYDPTIRAMDQEGSGYCLPYGALAMAHKANVDKAAMEIGGDFATIQLWWEALDCRKMSIAMGYVAPAYCRHFENAPKATATNVFMANEQMKIENVAKVGYVLATGRYEMFNVIMGTALWMPFMPTPALPLVGAGLLGLLLAGRGAWLRRRRDIQ